MVSASVPVNVRPDSRAPSARLILMIVKTIPVSITAHASIWLTDTSANAILSPHTDHVVSPVKRRVNRTHVPMGQDAAVMDVVTVSRVTAPRAGRAHTARSLPVMRLCARMVELQCLKYHPTTTHHVAVSVPRASLAPIANSLSFATR